MDPAGIDRRATESLDLGRDEEPIPVGLASQVIRGEVGLRLGVGPASEGSYTLCAVAGREESFTEARKRFDEWRRADLKRKAEEEQ
jgi:hypothetical protein